MSGSREVFRLRYQRPAREADEPEVGYIGGEVIEGQWNEPVTRYFWHKESLKRKIRKILNPVHEIRNEPEPEAAGRILSIERATVPEWNPAADLMEFAASVAAPNSDPTEEGT